MTDAERLSGVIGSSSGKIDDRQARNPGPESPQGQKFRTALVSASPLKPPQAPESRETSAT